MGAIKIHVSKTAIMNKDDCRNICDTIIGYSSAIRFVAVIGARGDLLAYARRPDLEALLDSKSAHYQFSHIAMKTELEAFFDESLGRVEFVWEERQRVQIISFAINEMNVWISIDKEVIRTKVLRIIDACLPIAKKYSTSG